jgi:drug/metabolite transporter (DMT)-like permease
MHLARRFDALPAPVRGAFWMILSGLLFSMAAAVVRHLAQEMHFTQIAFFRAFVGMMVFLPWLGRTGLIFMSREGLPA